MKKNLALLFSMLATGLPISTYADYHITNLTADDYVTAKLSSFATCSSTLGKKGIIGPGETGDIPQSAINTFCTFSDCHVYVYQSKNCSGVQLADITVNSANGITKIINLTLNHKIEREGAYLTLSDA